MLGSIGAALQGFGEGKMWRDKVKQRERELDIMESYAQGERQLKRDDHAAAESQRMNDLQASYDAGEQLSGQSAAMPRARSVEPPASSGSPQIGGGSPQMSSGSPPVVGGDGWLRYNNKGATRNKPISDDLRGRLGYLNDMGITMEVFSGGQDGIETGSKRRVGSTRHDHGEAADVVFYKDGRRLDWANEADQPVFEEIVRRGRAAGVTGFGAGPGYMQQGSMHIGMGAPGVWGAGGKGANAPVWLKAAFNNPWTDPAPAAVAAQPSAPAAPPQRPATAVAAAQQQPAAPSASNIIARGLDAGQSLADQILARIKG